LGAGGLVVEFVHVGLIGHAVASTVVQTKQQWCDCKLA
jgi:hypothetical protein